MRVFIVFSLLLSVSWCAESRDVQMTQRDWATCGATICTRVQEEAEDLARLKLLRTYVSETVSWIFWIFVKVMLDLKTEERIFETLQHFPM